MTKSKSKQNADSGYDASAAVAALEKSVNRQMEAWTKYWRIAHPLVKSWQARVSHTIAGTLDAENGASVTASIVQDADKGITATGKVYTLVKDLSGGMGQEANNLLYYLWRLSYRYNADGESIRNRLIEDFGLRNETTKTVSISQLAKLNASQNRPLVVAESILKGECPRKRDETLATFAKNLVADGYTYKDGKGKDTEVDSDMVYNFIEGNWAVLKDCQNVSSMIKLWVSKHSEPSDVLKRKAENRRLSREERWVRDIVVGKKTIAQLSATPGIKAEDKHAIEGEVYKKLGERFGSRIIRVSSALYPLTKLAPFMDTNEKGERFMRLADATLDEMQRALKAAKVLVPHIEKAIQDKEAEDLAQEFTRLMSQAKSMTAEQRAMLQEALAQ
jgi:hypothetical protein